MAPLLITASPSQIHNDTIVEAGLKNMVPIQSVKNTSSPACDSLTIGSSKPNVRTKFDSLSDYIDYRSKVQNIDFQGKLENDKGDTVPDLDKPWDTKDTHIGPHPEDYLDSTSPFHLTSFRKKGTPLGISTDVKEEALLTSGASGCSYFWITATDETGKEGIHSLFHAYPKNKDIVTTMAGETAYFQEHGYTRLKDAYIGGASIDQKSYAKPQPPARIKKTTDVAKSLVDAASKLGYENVVDHTRGNRPPYITKEVNVGGVKLKTRDGKVYFKPIGKGVFLWDLASIEKMKETNV
jgi:hypothetical protein